MRLNTAITQPGKLDDLIRVTGAGARGITVTGVRGLIGDGKIWVADVDSVVRVRTGERDRDAV